MFSPDIGDVRDGFDRSGMLVHPGLTIIYDPLTMFELRESTPFMALRYLFLEDLRAHGIYHDPDVVLPIVIVKHMEVPSDRVLADTRIPVHDQISLPDLGDLPPTWNPVEAL